MAAVEFDDETGFDAGKVHDVPIDRMLAAELGAAELAHAEMPPQGSVRIGHLAPKPARESLRASSDARHGDGERQTPIPAFP
jgi:hypothetical protein